MGRKDGLGRRFSDYATWWICLSSLKVMKLKKEPKKSRSTAWGLKGSRVKVVKRVKGFKKVNYSKTLFCNIILQIFTKLIPKPHKLFKKIFSVTKSATSHHAATRPKLKSSYNAFITWKTFCLHSDFFFCNFYANAMRWSVRPTDSFLSYSSIPRFDLI